jgi:predicted ribosome quality control (RQC) complex YloA/Tae2 family protein
MASKGRGYKTLETDGWQILVGKGDAENDRLTFEVAEPRDFWLHVAHLPGSHVVIRNPDELPEPPKSVLDYAAELAVWSSKAREAGGKVAVHLCRVADVSKRRGAPRGQVRLRRWEEVKIYPRDLSEDVEE